MNDVPASSARDSHLEALTGHRLLSIALSRTGHRSALVMLAVVVLIAVASVEIVSTYHVFSGTSDEPATEAAGMEWLDRGTYRLDDTHPPLARIAVALGPYLEGLRLPADSNDWNTVGNQIFSARGQYSRNLALARFGILPFFIFATVVVWSWGREALGEFGGLCAVLLFSTLPPVLGNAGLATTDIVLTATFIAASLALMHWLERPTYTRGCLLGFAVALAVLSKFSALLFLPVCGMAMLVCYRASKRRRPRLSAQWSGGATALALSGMLALMVVWGGYRFSYHRTDKAERPHAVIDRIVGANGALHDVAYLAAEHVPIPAPELIKGIEYQYLHNSSGSASYLFGHARQGGWWYFYPVVLAIKTPLPFLILSAIGLFSLAIAGFRGPDWRVLAAAAMAVALLLSAMPSGIDLGVRLILPIYPLLAIVAAFGAIKLWNLAKPKFLGRALVSALLIWQVVSCLAAHPDYLSYFNPLAGSSPERIDVGPDLDWGQDLFRLSDALRARHIASFSIAYLGSADLTQQNLPHFVELAPFHPATGWIAISLTRLMRGDTNPPYYGYSWLRSCKPVARVGRSILLYHVPAGGCPSRAVTETSPKPRSTVA